MSAPFLVVIPVALLAIVLLLSFIGCHHNNPNTQTTTDFFKYTSTILPTPGLVAYWPLGEATGTTAVNSHQAGANYGTYMSANFQADAAAQSAYAPGSLILGSPGILPGDLVSPFTAGSARTTCVNVNGGYVVVPASSVLNPPQSDGFTIEAWVKVEWGSLEPAHRAVLVSQFIDQAGNVSGFALYSTPSNCWEVSVGIGPTANSVSAVTSDPSATYGVGYYLAATYDHNAFTLTLYVDGIKVADIQTNYNVNWSQPLYIGAAPNRLPTGPVSTSLIYPFHGRIQSVALYKGALSASTILTHWHHGNGHDP
jgi:hypothetical protein